MSGLFSSGDDQIRSILLSILTAIVLGIPMTLIEKLFKSKNRILRIVGAGIFIGVILVCLYVSLTVAALVGVEKSNSWAVSYAFSFFSEFAFITPIVCIIKVKLFRFSLNGGDFCLVGILKRLFSK